MRERKELKMSDFECAPSSEVVLLLDGDVNVAAELGLVDLGSLGNSLLEERNVLLADNDGDLLLHELEKALRNE
jgi:hypothetical protein